jgi:hypothetical protein
MRAVDFTTRRSGTLRLEVGKGGTLSPMLVVSGTGVSRGMRRQFAAIALAHG